VVDVLARAREARLGVALWLVDSLADVDSLVEVLIDVESDSLVDTDAAARESDDVEPPADSEAADPPEVEAGAADSLVESDDVVEVLVDSGAADSLVAPALPGARIALPSVARVFRFAAVTSYEMGEISDIALQPFLPAHRYGLHRRGHRRP
jgi:hypothetical protein